MPAERTRLPIVEFPGEGRGSELLPPVTADTAPFYAALADGELRLQVCAACGRLRHPIAPVCPWCFASEFAWEAVSGAGTVHSWVRYHRAFVPAFASLLPYVVVTVALDVGPRLVGRLVGAGEPGVGMAVDAVVERWSDGADVLAFTPRRPARR
jgi:hypothetical protein